MRSSSRATIGPFDWRARIGLVKPTYGGKALSFWYRNAPDGVEIVPAFVGLRRDERTDFTSALAHAAELVEALAEARCQLISVSHAPAFLSVGIDTERAWAIGLQARFGVQVSTGVSADVAAIRAVRASRVAIVSYYGPTLNEAIAARFSRYGVETVATSLFEPWRGPSSDAYATSLSSVDQLTSRDVYSLCRMALVGPAHNVDCLYIAGAGWDAAGAIEDLERDLRVPVVWSLAAEMWFVYSRLRIDNRVQDCGSLLRDVPTLIEDPSGD
jgi:maleate cis-trans isomerase